MTGYTRKWTCVVCLDKQETMDNSPVDICEKCIEPLAAKMCREEILSGDDVEIWDHPAVNQDYFRRLAYGYANLMLRRMAPRKVGITDDIVDAMLDVYKDVDAAADPESTTVIEHRKAMRTALEKVFG